MGERAIQLKEFDEAIRVGKVAWVKSQLKTIPTRSVTRENLLPLAGIARRVGQPSFALKLLAPLVYPKNTLLGAATPQERASYALSLAAIGAVEEAFSLTRDIANSSLPEVQLCRAFLHIHSWDYEGAAAVIERYLSLDGPTDYQKGIAELNFCTCLLFLDRAVEVLPLAERLRVLSEARGWKVMHRDALLRLAQAFLQVGNWESARLMLKFAETVSDEHALEGFFVRKWQWILELQSAGMKAASNARGEALCQEAVEKRLWEGVRDLEYYQALTTHNARLAERVYFGSPFPAYRQRLQSATTGWLKIKNDYELLMGGAQAKRSSATPELNLNEAEDLIATRFLRCLSSDFYRPLTVGTLFTHVYRGEIYNPQSSPGRVRTALVRSRKWLQSHDLPLRIECIGQDYRLIAESACIVRVRLNYDPPEVFSGARELTQTLQKQLKGVWFSAEQAAKVIQLPPRKTRELLRSLVDNQALSRAGSGRWTQYRFAD